MEQAEFSLSDREFARVKARVHAEAGISLSEAKRTLVISRLSKVIRKLQLRSFDDYLDYLERAGSPADAQRFINALTTNLTRFYREDHHFEHLVEHVGHMLAAQPGAARQRLRIWSAGCSTGQEPYTIALALLDAWPELRRWDFKILATDVDTDVVAKAALGSYPEAELSGLTPERARLFERPGDGTIRVPTAARALVSFKTLNLMDNPWPMRGPFDVVFCRNVAIYFDKKTQGEVFSRLGRIIVPGGFLYIGHSENIAASAGGFRLVGKTVYQARPAHSSRDAA